MKPRFDGTGKQESVAEERGSAVLGAGGKSKKKLRNEGTVLPGLSNVLMGTLASFLPVASETVPVEESWVTCPASQKAKRWCTFRLIPSIEVQIAAEIQSIFLPTVLGEAEEAFCIRFWFRPLRDKFSALSTGTCLWRALGAPTIVLEGMISLSRASSESFKAVLCWSRPSVRSVLFWRKVEA